MQSKNYFSQIFKKGYFLFALLFTALAFTFLIMGSQSTLFKNISNSISNCIFMYSLLGVYAILIAIQVWLSAKNNIVDLSDSILISGLITSVLFFVYQLVFLSNISLAWSIALAVIFACCLATLIIKGVTFNKNKKDLEKTNKNHCCSLGIYIKALLKIYPVSAIIFTSLLLLSVLLLFFSPSLRIYIGFFKLNKSLITIILCLIAPLFYIVTSVSKKSINSVDLFLTSLYLAMPLTLLYIACAFGLSKIIILWAVIFALIIVLTIIRFATFDFSFESQQKSFASKCSFYNYLASSNQKYSLLFGISLGSLLALAFNYLFSPSHLYTLITYFIAGGGIKSPALLPLLFIFCTIYLALALLGFFTILGVKSNKITLGDFSTITLLSFAVLSLISLTQILSYTRLAFAICCLVISLAVLFARKNKFN